MLQIIESFNNLSEAITELDKVNLSQDESHTFATDILKAIEECIEVIQLAAPKHVNSNDGTDFLTESVLNTIDNLAKFVLRNTKPGTGPIVLDTPSVGLRLESDSIDNITDATVVIGDGNGFTLPSADKLFANQTLGDGTFNRIVIHLKRRGDSVNDVLSLSFTDRAGNEIEVKDTDEDIVITFASTPPEQGTNTLITGLYQDDDNVTYFGSTFNVSRLFHATIIMLVSNESVLWNCTAYIFNDVLKYSKHYRGYRFSVDVLFHGDHSTIFIPEDYFLMTGEYYLTFSVPGNQRAYFSMTVKQTVCTYLDKNTTTWGRQGCKVSSASNMTSTVCLCNHLTTFTVESI
ncbi:polycystin-1-like protein 3 [Ptychodera flava]|uniref:polycystin-1-like protein 3 n=1 Tax=Ptychodera flava TaxID=63121 RepID=UPI00396A2512